MSTTSSLPEYENIRLEHEENLTWIVLSRPQRANAMSNELLDEFSDALERLKTEGGPVLAIRGDGKGFSAGFDLGQVAPAQAADPVADRSRLQRNLNRFLAIWDHPKPVIAAVHGYCVAGATQLATFTDITIVADDARLTNTTVPVGAGYVSPVWAPLVGPKRAKELSFVPGNQIDGRTAVEWGWANHAVPADRLLDAVRQLAAGIALVPSDLLTIKKQTINRSLEAMGFRTALAGIADADALAHLSPNAMAIKARIRDEGLSAVRDSFKTPPTSTIAG